MIELLEAATNKEQPFLNGMPAQSIRGELEKILRSRVFVHSHRIRKFLQFVVEECLSGQQHRLKEYLIGLEVFNRLEAFDPRVDSIVRVEARRLRAKLDEYYQTEGHDDEVRIELRKGSYVPLFEARRNGAHAYGAPHAMTKRLSVGLAPLQWVPESPLDGKPDLERRLAHVLINEGNCQVIPGYDGASYGNGNSENGRLPDYVLHGTVETCGGACKIMLQLKNPSDGAFIWSVTGDGDGIEHMGRSLNRMLVLGHAQTQNERLQRHRSRSQSFDHYLQGRYLWKLGNPESIRSSVAVFAKAVEKDPSYAAAWAALAEALVINALFGFANPREAGASIREAATKALAMNDSLPEAHVAMGAVHSLFEWDWEAGEREFQHAIQLDGRDPSTHLAYALQLACRGMMSNAMVETERALELDPASLPANFLLGWLHSASKRYAEAATQHSVVSQLEPDFPLAYLGLGWACMGKEQFGDAIAHFTNASHLLKCRTLLSGCMGHCYARMGNRDEAMRPLALLTSQPPNVFTSPVGIAAIHAGLGEIDRALNALHAAADIHDCSLPLQLLNPEFENVRQDPRYPALLERIGLGDRQKQAAQGLA